MEYQTIGQKPPATNGANFEAAKKISDIGESCVTFSTLRWLHFLCRIVRSRNSGTGYFGRWQHAEFNEYSLRRLERIIGDTQLHALLKMTAGKLRGMSVAIWNFKLFLLLLPTISIFSPDFIFNALVHQGSILSPPRVRFLLGWMSQLCVRSFVRGGRR